YAKFLPPLHLKIPQDSPREQSQGKVRGSRVTRILTSEKHEEGDDNVQHIHRDDYKPEQHDGPSLNGNSEKRQREGSLAKGTRHDNEGL
ncbi:hypothetical protein E4U13_006438, partial [Claviceps humidiphila]